MNQKTTFLRLVITAFALIVFSWQANAQVTTAAISGVVVDKSGEGLPGATIVALHVPSGSKYAAVTNNSGRYTLPAVRVGGPFTVTATFIGYKTETKSGVITNLGTSSNVSF